MLLSVQELSTRLHAPPRDFPVVDHVSFDLASGQTLALVGESGCGKSLTALSILRLLPPAVRIVGGRIIFDGVDLLSSGERGMRAVRGNRIAIIFQEPMSSLNPVLTIGQQIAEPLRVHRGLPARAARARTVELLERVGIRLAAQRSADYPHQLSGGMRQRVMIAMALACEPALLIADEPTTALDVTIQAQILRLLHDLQRQTGMAMLFITHDLGVVADVADEVCVMYAGRIVERGPTVALLREARHPYTQGLLRCVPSLSGSAATTTAERRAARLPVISGQVPDPANRPAGCAFHPRCELGGSDPVCQTQLPLLERTAGKHFAACWKAAPPPT